jgi:hypothetical protein
VDDDGCASGPENFFRGGNQASPLHLAFFVERRFGQGLQLTHRWDPFRQSPRGGQREFASITLELQSRAGTKASPGDRVDHDVPSAQLPTLAPRAPTPF